MIESWALALSCAVVGVVVYFVVRYWGSKDDRVYERELRMDEGELRRRLEGRLAPVVERVPQEKRLAIMPGPRRPGPPAPRRPLVKIPPRSVPAPPRAPGYTDPGTVVDGTTDVSDAPVSDCYSPPSDCSAPASSDCSSPPSSSDCGGGDW